MAQHCYYRPLLSYLGLCVLPVVNMAELEAALVDWLNSLNLSHSVVSVGDMRDGVLLHEVLGKLYAGTGEISKEPHWAMQLCSLHFEEAALLRLLHSLGLENLHKERILRGVVERGEGLVELLGEVLCAAVTCEKKDIFLAAMQRLRQQSQHTLKDFIQATLQPPPDDTFGSQPVLPAEKTHRSPTRDRRNTLTALLVAEGALPRSPATDFGLSVENATLKVEREKLERELGEVVQKQEAAVAAENARLAGLSTIYEQQLKTLQKKIEGLESNLRESRQTFYEEKTQLLASTRALEMQLVERQQELQQVKSDKACLAEDLAQAYRLKDDWANKHIACRDEVLGLRRELASKVARLGVVEREVSRLSECRVDTQETEKVDREVEKLRERVDKLMSQLRRREERVASLRTEREELRQALKRERQVMKEVMFEANSTLRELGFLIDRRSV